MSTMYEKKKKNYELITSSTMVVTNVKRNTAVRPVAITRKIVDFITYRIG